MAKRVVNTINSPKSFQQEDAIQRVPISPSLSLPLQRQNSSIPAGPVNDEFENNLNHARSRGSGLEPKLRNQMESAMGADFSRVKIHTDTQSDQLSRSIQAKAFTTGQDVFFKQGAYNPGSRNGQELIAHELTHVVQQSGAQVQRRVNKLL